MVEIMPETILDSIFDGVYFVDCDRKITYWNKGAEHISGYSQEEVIGKCCKDGILEHADEAGAKLCDAHCPLVDMMTDGKPRMAVVYMKHKNGHRVPVETHVSAVRNASGEIIGGVEIFRDVTAWKKVEKLSLEKDELMGMVAHDLRSPLSIVRMYVSLIADNGVADPKWLQSVDSVCTQMTEMLESMLDIQKIENGKVRMNIIPMEWVSLLEEVCLEHTLLAKKKNITVDFSTGLPILKGNFDPYRMRDVLNNLISNGVKYSPPNTTVRVTLERTDDRAVISVADQGQGIKPGEIEKVFHKFAKISSQPTGGETKTGLGLAIVKKLVELHKGEVAVQSEINKGSTFTVSIPLSLEKTVS